MTAPIDITFDFRTETPKGGDPDKHSGTLREYHKALWSKSLPTGVALKLRDSRHKGELHHHSSELGELFLSSDTANSSYKQVGSLASLRDKIPAEDLSRFRTIMYSIGNMIVFPSRQIHPIQKPPTLLSPTLNRPRILSLHGTDECSDIARTNLQTVSEKNQLWTAI